MNSLINVPDSRPVSGARALGLAALSLLLSPAYWLAARVHGGPGLGVHLACVRTGFKLLVKKPGRHHARWIYYPMDSTRYIEIEFALREAGQFQKWLDVSSPRQLAALLLPRHRQASAMFLNPDTADIAETRQMTDLLGLKCETMGATVDAFSTDAKFDFITCVSVLEHIPDDSGALKKIWELLAPGGRFLLTIPVAADGGIQRISRDPYGVLQPHENGGFFFQRFYSAALVHDLQAITGAPLVSEIWGERERGWLQDNFDRKRRNPAYPVWREPYDIAKNWRKFDSIDTLPGEGVFCAVYSKPAR